MRICRVYITQLQLLEMEQLMKSFFKGQVWHKFSSIIAGTFISLLYFQQLFMHFNKHNSPCVSGMLGEDHLPQYRAAVCLLLTGKKVFVVSIYKIQDYLVMLEAEELCIFLIYQLQMQSFLKILCGVIFGSLSPWFGFVVWCRLLCVGLN